MRFEQFPTKEEEGLFQETGEKFGKQAERAMKDIIERFVKGVRFIAADAFEDTRMKVDGWIEVESIRICIPVQFSLQRDIMRGEKGVRSLELGIIPYWIDGKKIAQWIKTGDEVVGRDLARDFVETFKNAYALMKRHGGVREVRRTILFETRRKRVY